MTPEARQKLQKFDIQELRQELLIRGAGSHAMVAAALAPRARTLAGSADLTAFSSRDIADVLREQQKVIYGVDNRRDLFDVSDQRVLRNADGIVSLFRASRVRDNGDSTSTLGVGAFGQINSLCEGETFFNQPVGAFCTGSLVAPDLIATAGHCVNEDNVTTVRFVFGFRMIDKATAQTTIPNSDIYSGVEIIGRELTDDDTDWCVVRLDRPVADKHILALRRQGKLGDEQSVYVIGHPSGLPAKYADGVRRAFLARARRRREFFAIGFTVRSARNATSRETDAFSGGSLGTGSGDHRRICRRAVRALPSVADASNCVFRRTACKSHA
jgi:hypothetical protein